MSNWKGHIVFGIIFLAIIGFLDYKYFHILFINFDSMFFLVFAPLLILSTILPDIDIQASKTTMIATLVSILAIIYYAFQNNKFYVIGIALLILFIWILPKFNGWSHRGHAHSILFCLFVSALVIFISWKLAILFFLGAFSHLLIDRELKIF